MSCWNIRHGKWWMAQWCWDWWLSFGIHFDLKTRKRFDGISYGPYIDLHLGWLIISIGYNPAYSGELHKVISIGRGGL